MVKIKGRLNPKPILFKVIKRLIQSLHFISIKIPGQRNFLFQIRGDYILDCTYRLIIWRGYECPLSYYPKIQVFIGRKIFSSQNM